MDDEKKIGELIKVFLQRLQLGDVAKEAEIRNIYLALVGDYINRMTTRLQFRNGTLRLHTMTAALKHELSMRRDSLRKAINMKMGEEVVKRVVVY